MNLRTKISDWLSKPVSIAPLVTLRVIVGAMLVFSTVRFWALGCVGARLTLSQQRTDNMNSARWDQAEIDAIRADLQKVLAGQMQGAGPGGDGLKIAEVALLHYAGQSYDVPVADADLDDVHELGRQFHAAHEALFGFFTDEPWELSAIRTTLTDMAAKDIATNAETRSGDPMIGTRASTFRQGGTQPTAIFDRGRLPVGTSMAGPAIIEDEWSTIIVPPHDRFEVDGLGHIHIEVGEG